MDPSAPPVKSEKGASAPSSASGPTGGGDAGDQKSAVAGSSAHINLKVVGQDHNEVFFKIKRQTPLKRLMDAYCERQGKDRASVRFTFDGERLQETDTPDKLGMEDNDTIDVFVSQVGGCL